MTDPSATVPSVFTYRDRDLELVCSLYNVTWLNERGVELAVVADWLARGPVIAPEWPAGRMLEVGNVLGHYPEVEVQPHSIIDRYERGDGVANLDVFDSTGTYHTIVSISTLEHVRWDEPEPREPDGAWRAIEHLAASLEPGGRMLVTIPTGHHPVLDQQLSDRIGTGASFDIEGEPGGRVEACTLTRNGSTWAPEWVQTDEPWFLDYGLSTPWAESVWIGEFTRAA